MVISAGQAIASSNAFSLADGPWGVEQPAGREPVVGAEPQDSEIGSERNRPVTPRLALVATAVMVV